MSKKAILLMLFFIMVASTVTLYYSRDHDESVNFDKALDSQDRTVGEDNSHLMPVDGKEQKIAIEKEKLKMDNGSTMVEQGVKSSYLDTVQAEELEQLISAKNEVFEDKARLYDQNLANQENRVDLSESLVSDIEYKESLLKKFKLERLKAQNENVVIENN